MTYSCTLYYDTGFDFDNIPDSKALITNLTTKITVDAVWLLQDMTQGTIKVNLKWDEVYPVDYAVVNDKFYFVTDVKMLNENCAELTLQLDAITTIGLNNINIVSGWCKRRHVNDDTMFTNILSEPFTPVEPLEIDYQSMPMNKTSDDSGPIKTVILSSTIPLDIVEAWAEEYGTTDGSSTVTVPKVVSVVHNTTCVTFAGIGGTNRYEKTLPGTSLYNIDRDPEKYGKAVGLIWSLGLSDALTAFYVITSKAELNMTYWDEEVVIDDDHKYTDTSIKKLVYPWGLMSTNQIPYKWSVDDYTVKNNKVYSAQYNKFRVASTCSGNEQEFLAYQIANPNNPDLEYPMFYVNGDPSPNGKTYLRPMYYQGNDGNTGLDGFLMAVTGSQWANQQINLQGQSGSAISNLNRGFDYFNQTASFIGSLGGLTNILNNPGGILSPLTSGVSLQKSKLDYATQQRIVTPTVLFPTEPTLQEYVGNGFYATRERLSTNDTIRFDKYLTAYGYAVNEPMTKAVFTGRKYFNYVEADDLNLDAGTKIPLRLEQVAIQQLENGVRVWHTKPTATAFENNPIA